MSFLLRATGRPTCRLLADNLADTGTRVLAYALMTNHVHLVVIPERADSLAVLFPRAHGAYSEALNTRRRRTGHFWQSRFYSCPMAGSHLWIGLRQVEKNPVRASMVARPEEYRWSSAASHLEGVKDRSGVLDLKFRERSGGAETWREMYKAEDRPAQTNLLRRCTYSGRTFEGEQFVATFESQFQRKWRRWSFEKALDNRMLA